MSGVIYYDVFKIVTKGINECTLCGYKVIILSLFNISKSLESEDLIKIF